MSTTTMLGLRPQLDLALTIPLLSSSLTVFYAIMEGTLFYCFQQSAKQDLPTTAKVMRLWWSAFFAPGVSLIFAVTVPGWLVASMPSDVSNKAASNGTFAQRAPHLRWDTLHSHLPLQRSSGIYATKEWRKKGRRWKMSRSG